MYRAYGSQLVPTRLFKIHTALVTCSDFSLSLISSNDQSSSLQQQMVPMQKLIVIRVSALTKTYLVY